MINTIKKKLKAKIAGIPYSNYNEFVALKWKYNISEAQFLEYKKITEVGLSHEEVQNYLTTHLKKYNPETYIQFCAAVKIGYSQTLFDGYLESNHDHLSLEKYYLRYLGGKLNLTEEELLELISIFKHKMSLEEYSLVLDAQKKGISRDQYHEVIAADKLGLSLYEFQRYLKALTIGLSEFEYYHYEYIVGLVEADKECELHDIRHLRILYEAKCKKVIISDEITHIPDLAFYGFRYLESIQLPTRLKSIGKQAFAKCTSLKQITIPGSVNAIPEGVFDDCDSLEDIIMDPGVSKVDITGWTKLKSVRFISSPWTIKTFSAEDVANAANSSFEGNSAIASNKGDNPRTIILEGSCAQISDAFKSPLSPFTEAIIVRVRKRGRGAKKILIGKQNLPHLKYLLFTGEVEELSFGDNAFSNLLWLHIPPGCLVITLSQQKVSYLAMNILGRIDHFPNNLILYSLENSDQVYHQADAVFFIDEGEDSLVRVSRNAFEMGLFSSSVLFHWGVLKDYKVIKLDSFQGEIPSDTFSGSHLETLHLSSKNKLQDYAFKDCLNLNTIIADDVPDMTKETFYGCTNIKQLQVPDVMKFIESAGRRWFDIGEFSHDIFAGTTTIAKDYYSCSGIKELIIPAKIRSIGSCAFRDSKNLKKITFKGKPTEIAVDAFESCINVEEIIWGKNDIFHIAGETGFPKIKNMDIPNSVTTIHPRTFFKWGLESVTWSEHLKSIETKAFQDCSRLQSINGENEGVLVSSKFFAPDAFVGCSSLHTLKLTCTDDKHDIETVKILKPKNVIISEATKINLFKKLLQIEGIVSITTYKDHNEPILNRLEGLQFVQSTNLETLMIPNTVAYIDEDFFSKLPGLKELHIPPVTRVFDFEALQRCVGLEKIVVPLDLGVEILESKVLRSNQVQQYGETDNNVKVLVINTPVAYLPSDLSLSALNRIESVILENECSAIGEAAFKGLKGLLKVEVRGVIEHVGDEAFYGCSNLQSIEFPPGLVRIGTKAFADSGLEHVPLPDSVNEIGEAAFLNCKNIQEIHVPFRLERIKSRTFKGCVGLRNISGMAKVTYVEENAFKDCRSLQEIIFSFEIFSIVSCFEDCDSLKKIVIPGNLGKFDDTSLFRLTNLQEVYMPKVIEILNTGKINRWRKEYYPLVVYSCYGSKWNKRDLKEYITVLKKEDYESLIHEEMRKAGLDDPEEIQDLNFDDFSAHNERIHTNEVHKRAEWSIQTKSVSIQPEDDRHMSKESVNAFLKENNNEPEESVVFRITDVKESVDECIFNGTAEKAPVFTCTTEKRTVQNNLFRVHFKKTKNSADINNTLYLAMVNNTRTPITNIKAVEILDEKAFTEFSVKLELQGGIQNGEFFVVVVEWDGESANVLAEEPFTVDIVFAIDSDFLF